MIDTSNTKRHTISLLVANKPGVLIRIALVFARRGYNIDSLVVSPSQDLFYSRMNIVAIGDAKVLDQILKHLNKLIDVISARDRTDDDIIQKELALFKLTCKGQKRFEAIQLAQSMNGEIIDVTENSLIVEINGDSEKIDAAKEIFSNYDIRELVRTGKVLMSRGAEATA